MRKEVHEEYVCDKGKPVVSDDDDDDDTFAVRELRDDNDADV